MSFGQVTDQTIRLAIVS